MKKFLLSLVVMSATAVSAQEFTYQWNRLLGGTASETATAVVDTKDNTTTKFISLNTAGAADAFLGETSLGLVSYSAMTTPSYLAITGMDGDGNVTWNVISTSGYVNASNASSLAATNDGGAVAAFRVRADGRNDVALELTDAAGTTMSVANPYPDVANAYVGVVVKISGTGELEWVASCMPEQPWMRDNGSYAVDLFTLNGVAEDGDGNVYVGGHFVGDLTFVKADGTITVSPLNKGDWSGDSQNYTNYGDLFIAKFDGNGVCEDVLTVDADSQYATSAQIVALAECDGNLYFAGMVRNNGSDFNLGGVEVKAEGELHNIIVGSINSDLSVDWVNNIEATPFTDGKHTTQLKALDVYGSNVYVSGLVKGGFNDDAGVEMIASSKTQLEGFIISVNASSGAIQNAAVYGSGISGYFGVLENADTNSLWTYGYHMTGGKVMLVKYALDTMEKQDEVVVLTASSMPTAWDYAYDDDTQQLVLLARGKATMSFYGTDETVEPTKNDSGSATFDGVFLSYNASLPMVSGIEAVIEIESVYMNVEYYNLQGVKVKNPKNGIYIRKQGNKTSKVMVN